MKASRRNQLVVLAAILQLFLAYPIYAETISDRELAIRLNQLDCETKTREQLNSLLQADARGFGLGAVVLLLEPPKKTLTKMIVAPLTFIQFTKSAYLAFQLATQDGKCFQVCSPNSSITSWFGLGDFKTIAPLDRSCEQLPFLARQEFKINTLASLDQSRGLIGKAYIEGIPRLGQPPDGYSSWAKWLTDQTTEPSKEAPPLSNTLLPSLPPVQLRSIWSELLRESEATPATKQPGIPALSSSPFQVRSRLLELAETSNKQSTQSQASSGILTPYVPLHERTFRNPLLAPQTYNQPLASISGRVLALDLKTGLTSLFQGVLVELAEHGATPTISFITNDGAFEFTNLSAGQYIVRAYKEGYWWLPDTPIDLEAGTQKQVNVFLYRR